ncbi:hypothetical protein ABVG11_36865 [Streptomyces sp. HD1123-B1]|uniref:hypothetical protein n=1 Tax=Streptomyces huangiella TaxID=3228804 RepID=UPI003D7E116C
MRTTTGASEWETRLGWARGLTADDPAVRSAALDRLADTQTEVGRAVDCLNAVYRRRLWIGRATALKQYERATSRSLPHALWDGPADQVAAWPGLPFALLYLEWEARHPQEWTRHAKDWGTKESMIRLVAEAVQDKSARGRLIDLTEIVVQRAYRCKDREYVRVARAVDSDELRGRLTASARSDNPWAQCHAGYVLWLLDRPELPNTRHVWQTWLRTKWPRRTPDRGETRSAC